MRKIFLSSPKRGKSFSKMNPNVITLSEHSRARAQVFHRRSNYRNTWDCLGGRVALSSPAGQLPNVWLLASGLSSLTLFTAQLSTHTHTHTCPPSLLVNAAFKGQKESEKEARARRRSESPLNPRADLGFPCLGGPNPT